MSVAFMNRMDLNISRFMLPGIILLLQFKTFLLKVILNENYIFIAFSKKGTFYILPEKSIFFQLIA